MPSYLAQYFRMLAYIDIIKMDIYSHFRTRSLIMGDVLRASSNFLSAIPYQQVNRSNLSIWKSEKDSITMYLSDIGQLSNRQSILIPPLTFESYLIGIP